MFLHKHPYKPFIQKDTTKLIVGTLPPPRFYNGMLKKGDVNFCYGSIDGQLWKILDKIFTLNLKYETTEFAIEQRKSFLTKKNIGICDIVASCERTKIDASDLGMENIKLRNILSYIKSNSKIETLLLTGGNSKNGPEYFFRKHLKTYNLKLELVHNEVPRIHQFQLPIKPNQNKGRIIKTVSLTSGSGAANISISRIPLYKQLKAKNPEFNTFDFRVMQYREFL